ncbi:MAG: GMC family oxidoreductase [Planctomycetes bacterium]|nr:GMC family oxidoreductase [Planctomycetota bacterium]
MIHDLAEARVEPAADYDLVIVGSGPAAMTLVRELADSGVRIAVLESGRRAPTPFGDRLRRVESDGIRIKDYSRERVFGGASTTWAGLSSPLDPIDFATRSWLGESGWPIERDELLPYYASAERYRFPSLAMFGGKLAGLREKGEWRPTWNVLEEKVFLACAEPQNFAREHGEVFANAGVELFLDATALALVGERSSGRIERARVRTSTGRELDFRAGTFVVATGGLENARLLLASRDLCDRGLGNEHDQVGRWLMNHPKNYHGIVKLTRPLVELPYYFGALHQGFAGYAGLRLNEKVQRERELVNSYVRFEPLFPWSDSRGVESLVALAKRSKLVMKRVRGGGTKTVALRDYSETGDDSDLQNERKTAAGWIGLGWNVIADAPRVARYAYNRVLARSRPKVRAVRLRNFMEMEPNPENRVMLGNSKDELGQPLTVVRHRPTERDRRSLIELHAALREELAATGLGELETNLSRAEPWPIDQDASHHMGTTRMGRDPRRSVVDRDLRLHATPNVFLAGASVFPTSGCANPTFTLTALSIRLAEHLKTRVLASRAETKA